MKKIIDDAFAKTTRLILGEELHPIDRYEDWLLKRIPKGELCKSCMSERRVLVPGYSVFRYVPKDRIAGLESFQKLSQRQIEIDDDENLDGISRKLRDMVIYITELSEGENSNVIESSIYLGLHNAFRITDCFHSKYIAYNFFTDYTEYTFGVQKTFNSKFCIHTYNSRDVTMGFEADVCKNCSGIMFCHNCENVRESLFCFNAKNLRYAIGNNEVGREKYLEVKKMLNGYILENLKEKGHLDLDIYDIGCKRGREIV